ncbi:hypothetical protein BD309DRAFT_969236 [Dichomitus squalens]|uniref:Uncharacterized protein n=1 Tax=Dichomitus squalens TaxID=114155 RepID=A0A4Q9PLC3_9APHY|nr:hypothetical protein BD309DRAFT_969236 [Dichomitus squalens]TBU55000.1 hypothetical protein BD310DRAFT_934623 [Dichomitus squalens]
MSTTCSPPFSLRHMGVELIRSRKPLRRRDQIPCVAACINVAHSNPSLSDGPLTFNIFLAPIRAFNPISDSMFAIRAYLALLACVVAPVISATYSQTDSYQGRDFFSVNLQ